MADSKDPRLDDETRLQEFRRLAAEIAADAPTPVRIVAAGAWATAARAPQVVRLARASLPLATDEPLTYDHLRSAHDIAAS